MCKEQEEAYRIFMKEFYNKEGREFTLQEVEETLMEKAKTTRIAPSRDIRDWLRSAKIRGEIIEIEPYVYKVVN